MATADSLSLYETALDSNGLLAEDNTCRIVCERHEDWAVVVDDDVELVSAKHRDAPYGAYTTVNQLADDGGIAHLFKEGEGDDVAVGEVGVGAVVADPPLELEAFGDA
ncbi:hypothetical protein EES47_23630 [Streptomyces sp. ADI98-12]|nr:hypothetical protein EES47_23630 [Streptomyces sp. ADI98-12]